jgi:ribosomal-protein-serine acetyltransferase
LNRIEILVPTENPASVRVAEKAGAKKEGILRNRLVLHDCPQDAVMYSLIAADLSVNNQSLKPQKLFAQNS